MLLIISLDLSNKYDLYSVIYVDRNKRCLFCLVVYISGANPTDHTDIADRLSKYFASIENSFDYQFNDSSIFKSYLPPDSNSNINHWSMLFISRDLSD